MSSLQDQYNSYKATIETSNQKVFQFETDIDQHDKVLEVLHETDPKRQCKHMVNNVLVDLSVEEVIPRIEKMKEGIEKALESVKTELILTEKNSEDWKAERNIKVVS